MYFVDIFFREFYADKILLRLRNMKLYFCKYKCDQRRKLCHTLDLFSQTIFQLTISYCYCHLLSMSVTTVTVVRDLGNQAHLSVWILDVCVSMFVYQSACPCGFVSV